MLSLVDRVASKLCSSFHCCAGIFCQEQATVAWSDWLCNTLSLLTS